MSRRALSALVLSLFVPLVTSLPSLGQTPTFRSNVRVVNLDIVVTDGHGRPITGLRPEDIVVTEDGHRQALASFEYVRPGAMVTASEHRMPLPPGEFTNLPDAVPKTVNIIVLDLLNSPMENQSDARMQMILLLRSLPPGRQVALFTLTTRLNLVQPFTASSDELIAAANKIELRKSALYQSEADKQREFDSLFLGYRDSDESVTGGIIEAIKQMQVRAVDNRVMLTIDALRQLARASAVYSGRKNVIWVSGGFPLLMLTPMGSGGIMSHAVAPSRDRNYEPLVRQVSAQLAAANIAMYPVDIFGQLTSSADATTWGSQLAYPEKTAEGYVMVDRAGEVQQHIADVHSSMQKFAEYTGGRAFYNSNDLKSAMQKSMDLGASYYAVSYRPSNQNFDGRFRKIEVKIAHRRVQLAYRRGYYAILDTAPSEAQISREMSAALKRESPPASEIVFTVKLLPQTDPVTLEYEYSLDGNQFQVTGSEGKPIEARFDLSASAWSSDGKATGSVANMVTLPMTADSVAQYHKAGIRVRQTLHLTGPVASLRIAVLDRNTGRLGSLDVPVATKVP